MLLLVKHFQQVVRHSGPDASEQGSTHYDKSYYQDVDTSYEVCTLVVLNSKSRSLLSMRTVVASSWAMCIWRDDAIPSTFCSMRAAVSATFMRYSISRRCSSSVIAVVLNYMTNQQQLNPCVQSVQ